MPGFETTHTLLATLGGQPQIVTFTLDLLLQRGIPISEVIVVHPASYARLEEAISALAVEFASDYYRQNGAPIRFRQHILTQYEQPIDDIVDEQTTNNALNAMDELIRVLKQEQRTIHFSITGGRRLIGYLSFSAALLNFGPADCLWHLNTPDEVKLRARDGAIMHVSPGEGVHLIEVPFARIAQPILARVLSTEPTNARTVITDRQTLDMQERHKHCSDVVKHINHAPLKVLRAFAQGLEPQQVADYLGREISTVSSHTNTIFKECRNTWGIPEQKRLDYHFLQQMFVDYFQDGE